MSQKASPN